MLRPRVFPDYEALSRSAADWLIDRLHARPDALICLAAGSTPADTYELLARHGSQDPSLVARCRFLKLDEWGGLAMDDPATCEHQLRTSLVGPLDLGERYTAFQSRPSDPQAECARIADWLERNGPIDVCVLGLGVNGHIGFNEPAETLQPHAHVAELSAASLQHPMLRQSSQWPNYGLTLGMADILQSREVILLATGQAKREPTQRLLDSEISTRFPASFLQLHPAVQFICDEAAMPVGTIRGKL